MFTRAPWAQQAAEATHCQSPAAVAQPQRPGQRGFDQTTSGFAFSPASWDAYFDASREVAVATGVAGARSASLRVYTAGGEWGGAGQSPRPSALAVYVLLHGGGLSSLSWAMVAARLKHAGHPVVAHDLRAHGGSGGTESELTVAQLCADTRAVIRATTVCAACAGAAALGPDCCCFCAQDAASSLVLVGHSLGGAVAARVAGSHELRERVAGVAMIDIAEACVPMHALCLL